MDIAALVVAIVALAAAGAAALYAKRSNQIAVLTDFLREFRRMEPERRRVLLELPDYTTTRLVDLDETTRAETTQVMFYLDALGLLIRQGLVDEDPVYSILGKPIWRTWEKLAPYIEAERVARPEPRYMAGFEHLAEGARLYDYGTDLARLRRFGGGSHVKGDAA